MEPFDDSALRNWLKTEHFGRSLQFFKQTTSTQHIAQQLAAQGNAPEGQVVFADEQTSGKGRRDNIWESPKGVNLYFSLIFRPRNPSWPMERAHEIQFMSAVATARVLKAKCGVAVELKWPNDLWLNGKKIGGIILSTGSTADGGINFIVMGMGLNLNADSKQLSHLVRQQATSVWIESKKKVERAPFFAALLSELEKTYKRLTQKGIEEIHQEWQRLAPRMLNGDVILEDALVLPGHEALPSLRGKAQGIDREGHLLVQTTDGRKLVVIDGTVRF